MTILAGIRALFKRSKPAQPRPRRDGDLDYLGDSPEQIGRSMEATGWKDKLDQEARAAIARARRNDNKHTRNITSLISRQLRRLLWLK